MSDIDKLVDSINDLVSEMKGNSPAANSQQSREDSIKLGEERREQLAAEMRLEEDLQKKTAKKIELLKNEIELNKLSSDSVDDKAKANKRLEKGLAKLTKKQDKLNEETEGYSSAVESVVGNLAGFFGVSRSYEKSLLGQIVTIGKNKKAQKELAEQLTKTFNGYSMIAAAAAKTAQAGAFLFSDYEKATVTFNQATGMAHLYNDALMTLSEGHRRAGVDSADYATSLTALTNAFPLRELNTDAMAVAQEFAVWEKFGVSADIAAQSFTTLVRSFGETSTEALATQEQIMSLGVELRMGPAAIMKSFNEALPRLAIFGNQYKKIFRGIASSAAQLGLSVDDVLTLSESFQTFEGSAKVAGNLNAILGGGFIDNLELMQAAFSDPTKALSMVKSAFKLANKTTSDMSPAMLAASAKAAGFTNVDKFRAFLDGTLSAEKLIKDKEQNIALDTLSIAKDSMGVLQQIFQRLKALADGLLGEPVKKLIKNLNFWLEAQDSVKNATAKAAAIGVPALVGGGKALAQNIDKFDDIKKATDVGKVAKNLKLGKEVIKVGGLGGLKSMPLIGSLLSMGFNAFDLQNSEEGSKKEELAQQNLVLNGIVTGIAGIAAIAAGTATAPLWLGAATLGALAMAGKEVFLDPAEIKKADAAMKQNDQTRQANEQSKKVQDKLSSIETLLQKGANVQMEVNYAPGTEKFVQHTVKNMYG
jgi:hypothetical protein